MPFGTQEDSRERTQGSALSGAGGSDAPQGLTEPPVYSSLEQKWLDSEYLIENLDTISSLFGNEELLLALVDHPAKVHEFQRAILPLYLEHHRQLYEAIKDEVGGSAFGHFNAYGKGRVAKLQCDFSAMISTAMFEEFVVPYLGEQCRQLDHTVYHWDGPCALQHEGPLLAIEELQAIQWTPGAGNLDVGERV